MDQLETIQIICGKDDTPGDKNIICQRMQRKSTRKWKIRECGAAADLTILN